jgi:hypothetical protein
MNTGVNYPKWKEQPDGCGKIISARQNFDGLHVLDKKRTPLQDAQKCLPQPRNVN